jgi:hypothetical protein
MAAPQVQHGQGSVRRSSLMLMLMMQRHQTMESFGWNYKQNIVS